MLCVQSLNAPEWLHAGIANTMSCWYLILTKASGELVARANLERQGYEVYLPRILQQLRRGGRWVESIVALFPRYLFLRLREGRETLAPVRSTKGVTNVVQFGPGYAKVSDQVIVNLRSREEPDSGLHRLNSRLPMAAGTPVRITFGAFLDLEGIFERECGAERVIVLLKLLGREAEVRVATNHIVSSAAAL
jgi:transcriptional antiterminator RfaH